MKDLSFRPWNQRTFNRQVWVLNKVLVCQADLGEELVEAAFHDLVNDVSWLAFVQSFFLEDAAFVFQAFVGNFAAVEELG